MIIVIITGTAPPEPITAGRVHWDLANYLASEKNTVWLISPYPSRPLGLKYPKQKGNKITQVNQNFYHVNIDSYSYPRYRILHRSYESLDFGIKAIRFVKRSIKDYDLIYASPWAFLGQLMIILLHKRRKTPLIMNVQDLYPESFCIKVKSKTMNRLLKPLYAIDKYIVKHSTHLTVVSDSLKQIYLNERQVKESKISIIHNWQDETEFLQPVIPKEQVFEKYHLNALNGKFVFMYLGNIGPVAGVETIIEAFADLKNEEAALVIAGSGSYKEKCQSLADRLHVPNTLFIEVPAGLKPVVELQSIADILLLPILPEAAHSSIPSKLIAYMFSKKPIITSANMLSETANAINKSNSGWIIKQWSIPAWSEQMRIAFHTDKEILHQKGRSGFDYALMNHSKQEGLKKMKHLIYKFKN